jgi:tetratricopeptide (TPR) repeat protein
MNAENTLQSAIEYHQAGNLQQAEIAYKNIINKEPDNAYALHLLGIVLYQQKRPDLAIQYIKKSLDLDPENAEAYYNLGMVFKDNGQKNEAIDCYHKALRINPFHAATYNNLGIVLKDQGRHDEAVSCFEKAIEYQKDLVAAYYNLGTIQREKGNSEEAANVFQKALEADPLNSILHSNLGLVFMDRGMPNKAISHYRTAVEHDPDNAFFNINLGIALQETGQIDEAVMHLEKSFSIEPNDTALDQIFEVSHIILRNGDMKKGWGLYWKYNDAYWLEQIPGKPIWNGSDIRGLTIVLQSDAGFGDAVQYVRYARLVAEKGANVIINCQKEILSLMKRVDGINKSVTNIPLSQFDLFIPLRRLPLVFGTMPESIPRDIPYIHAEPALIQKWKDKTGADKAKLKIGLVWAAGHGATDRSCPPILFSPFSYIDNITFYSLQVGKDSSVDHTMPDGFNPVDYTEELHDFSDTAAFIENLDLVISVDTAVAHVAGALGRLVWVLIPYHSDSRWLSDREDSPWYPTMRLFRQTDPGNWEGVIHRATEALKILLQ